MNENIIETHGLTMYYGEHPGIIDVDLEVQKGEVFGFLGPNGAGKTTALRVLLDVIRPCRGKASIFGLDCQKRGVAIRKEIGYLPGELSLYPGLKAHSFLNLLASLNDKAADINYRQELYERLNLDPTRIMKTYSRGNKQKIGIIAAFMGKPNLLILDEPTSGLDPLMQQVVMELVQEARADGRTVFFSSHILPEVQAVCDRVGIIRAGRLVKTDRVENLTRQQFKRLQIRFRELPPQAAFVMDGVVEKERMGNLVTLEVAQNLDKLMHLAVSFGIEDIESLPVTLEEIFLAFYDDDETDSGGAHV